jgi:glycosyltransferase involved in cell wall biosynthesis
VRSLIWIAPGARAVTGGYVIQAERTASALAAFGVEATVTDHPDPDLSGVDVVHAMGLPPELLERPRGGRPIVMSTIYWPVYGRPPGWWRRRFRESRMAAAAVSHWRRIDLHPERSRRRRAYLTADLLLPNSVSEAAAIRDALHIDRPWHVVPNAADATVFAPPRRDAPRRGVVMVGRLEPHKNQLGLIRALRGSGVPLTIVGNPHPDHPAYADACYRAADAAVTFESGREQSALPALYQAAVVHALPSWWETTGLVSLEAALSGCQIVTTSRGFAFDYFEDLAHYCDPQRPASIAVAVARALDAEPSPMLRERVATKFSWVRAAEETHRAYLKVLGSD